MNTYTAGRDLPNELRTIDLEDRLVLGTGIVKGEVLAPYQSAAHQRKAENILAYLLRSNVVRTEGLWPYHELKDSGQEIPKVVEVVGGLADVCVARAASDLVKNDHIAIVNPKLTLVTSPTESTRSWLGGLIIRSVFELNEEANCHVYNGKLMFYS